MIAFALSINVALVWEACKMLSPLNDEDREYTTRELPSPFATAASNVFSAMDGISASSSVPLSIQAEAGLLACSMVDNPLWAEDASADDPICRDDTFEDMPLPSAYDCKLAAACLTNCPAAAFSNRRLARYDRACRLAGVFNTDTEEDIHDLFFNHYHWKPAVDKATTCDDILSGSVDAMLDTFGPIPDLPALAAAPALLCTPAPSVSSACGSPFASFANSCASSKRSLFGSPADSVCLDNPLFDSEDEEGEGEAGPCWLL